MFKEFEVLEVYTDRFGEVEDSEPLGSIQLDEESEDFYVDVLNELIQLGINVPHTWDLIKDDYMGTINVYNTKGICKYQLKGF